ncbi:MAG: hybrid sensor histidine kinase/response regulator [Pseudomonadales bacterium]
MPLEGHSILVVDDDSGNLALLTRILQRKGYRTLAASSGAEALDLAHGTSPDLILLDVLMPGMDGYETCRRLRTNASLAEVPILFISGKSDSVDRLEAFHAGGVDYITKPFDGREVIARVKAHLDIQDLQIKLKQRNAQLQEFNDQLRELEAHRDQLVSMIVHDMRSPITVINSTLKLIGDELKERKDEEFMEDIRIAVKNGEILSKMAEDLLHVSRLESGTVELNLLVQSLPELIHSVVETRKVSAAGIDFGLALDENVPPVAVDSDVIKRVLDNLIGNAISFSQKGDSITLDLTADRDNVIVGIGDNGPGVSEDMQAKIFEKFHSGGAGRKHSIGLGLAFCKLAVEAHGGNIGVCSEPGSGSRFWFTLPVRS